MTIDRTLATVTDRIRRRSAADRSAYLERLEKARRRGPLRNALGCTNLAHAWAAAPAGDKIMLREARRPNVAIVSSYNDMLSAHLAQHDLVAGRRSCPGVREVGAAERVAQRTATARLVEALEVGAAVGRAAAADAVGDRGQSAIDRHRAKPSESICRSSRRAVARLVTQATS